MLWQAPFVRSFVPELEVSITRKAVAARGRDKARRGRNWGFIFGLVGWGVWLWWWGWVGLGDCLIDGLAGMMRMGKRRRGEGLIHAWRG